MYQVSNKRKMKLNRWFWITVSWVLVAQFQVLYDYLTLRNYAPAMLADFDYQLEAGIKLGGAVVAGLLGAWVLVFRKERITGTKSFRVAVLQAIGLYLATIALVSALGAWAFQAYQLSAGVFDAATLQAVLDFMIGPEFLKLVLFWGGVFGITALVMMANDKYGPGQLRMLVLGKYHQPRQEERIFMFLDIRSSTTIAEQLGEAKYFELCRDFFHDITDPVLVARGKFYQYVGDEAVISWSMRNGLTNAHCLRCFFAIHQRIQELGPHYEVTYGVIPEFKAGVHCGTVTAGEIGVVKRDLVFSGDVLNTTARIQAKCNALGADLLVSDELIARLGQLPNLQVRSVGRVELRGKAQPVGISAVSEQASAG